MNEHIELPALPEVIQMGSRSAKDVMREYARTAVIADRASQQRVLAEQAEPDDPNYPFYELKFIMRVLGHEGRAPREDWQTACGMARAIFTRWHSEKIASPPAPQEAQAVPPGFALVSVEQLTHWKQRVNTLASLSLKAERHEVGGCLKTEIADVIADPLNIAEDLAAPVAQPATDTEQINRGCRYTTDLMQPATEQAEAPRNIIWDAKHPDYPVEWSNPGRAAREGEVHYIRYDLYSDAVHAAQPTASNAGEREGWKEAAIAWTVCASVHEQWAKGKDALYKTRHTDFERHADAARAQALSDAPPVVPTNQQISDYLAGLDNIRAALASKPAEPVAPPAGEALRALIHGMSVSVDVSTNDETAGHRYMGTVTEVMDDLGDKHGLTLLVQDAEPNFSATTPAPAGQIDALRELFALHAAEVENNPYAYCEVAYTRATGWMAWITDKPLACVVESPDRKVLLRGQGDTPEEAAAAALRAARGDEVKPS